MELKNFDDQRIVIELSREEFRIFMKMGSFINDAYELVDKDVMHINIPRHKVDEVVNGIGSISKKLGIR